MWPGDKVPGTYHGNRRRQTSNSAKKVQNAVVVGYLPWIAAAVVWLAIGLVLGIALGRASAHAASGPTRPP